MKKTLLLAALLLTGLSLKAQETFATIGGDASGTSGNVSFTVGQTSVITNYERVSCVEHASANVREGVQQTYGVEELMIDGVIPLGFDIKVYPNPTTNYVTVRLEYSVSDIRYELYGIDGRLLKSKKIDEIEQTIDMKDYPSGGYLLRVVAGKKQNNYRITKTR